MLFKLFPRMRVWSLEEPLTSRDAIVYLDRGMFVCGWMPPKDKFWRWIYALWTLYSTLVIMILGVVALFISYIKDLNSFSASQFLTSLQVGPNCVGASIKAAYTFAGMKRFNQAKEILDRLDKRCNSTEQRQMLHRTVALCNRCYMCYQFMYSFFVMATFLAGSLAGHMPWNFYNPFIDWEASKLDFWLSAILEYNWMSGIVMLDQIADVYPVIYFLILRTHITVLKERLQRLRTDPAMSEEENNTELIKCIEDHHLIIL